MGGATTASVQHAIDQLWQEAEPSFVQRVDAIEEHLARRLSGEQDPRGRDEAQGAAHKLAGTMGMFGMAGGSTLAAELEMLLGRSAEQGSIALDRMAEIVNELRSDLRERASAPAAPSGARPPVEMVIRVIGRDSSLLESVRWSGARRGMRVDHVKRAEEAGPGPAAATIVDATSVVEPLGVIERFADQGAPVLVVADSADLVRRAAYLDAGADTVVSPSGGPGLIVDQLGDLIGDTAGGLSVAAVGFTPADVAAMRVGFETAGCAVTPVQGAGGLGRVIEGVGPDVIAIGDRLDGLDLLRGLEVVTADPVWSSRWILAVVPTVRQAASLGPDARAAGADDVLSVDRGWPAVAHLTRMRAQRVVHLRRGRFDAAGERAQLESRLAGFVASRLSTGRQPSIVVFNVIGVAEVNARDGFRAGDQILARVEQFLRTSFASDEVVGPWVGSSFVVAMTADRRSANERLATTLEELGQAELPCRGAVATAPEDGCDVDALVSAANRRSADVISRNRAEGQSPRRITVVEDDEVVGHLVRELLEAKGHEVELITDGPTAASVLSRPDVSDEVAAVLLDITLPGLDGFGVLRAMQRANTVDRIPVVMLTARVLESEVNVALELGAVDHVAKPFSPQVLLRRVERALALGRP